LWPIARLPSLRLDTDILEWCPNFTLRGLKAFPVAW
jgi:hypothetical protein